MAARVWVFPMYKYVWKLLGWPVAVVSGGMAGFDATLWIGDVGEADRLVGALVCGFLAAAMWLLISTTLRAIAEQ
jgi:hypothetical protein